MVKETELVVDGVFGRYAPQEFVQRYFEYLEGAPDDTWSVICEEGPDHEHYWEVWDDVQESATLNLEDGEFQIQSNHEGVFITPTEG